MTAGWLLAGPPIAVSAVLVVAICRAARRGDQQTAEPPRQYVPPPITDQYVNAEFAILRWHYHHTTTHQEKP